jgi:galactose mutarotase-like enzyme
LTKDIQAVYVAIRVSDGKANISSTVGFRLIHLENDRLVASFLPELGAKMISLKSASSNREFLLHPPGRPYHAAGYGASFADYDSSGFDECCPTVSECQYPTGEFAGAIIPDHGDLWSTAWQCDIRDGELYFEVRGTSLPYIFRKCVRLEGNAIVLRYEIASTGSREFAFLWSAHPLLAVEPGCRIVLPTDVSGLFVNWSREERLGRYGDSCGWPVARTREGEEVDLSELSTVNAHTADKLFTSRLSKGECGLSYPSTDEALIFQFDPILVPYLGLWICQGGWPSGDHGHFTVALEPCTGRPDSLRESINMGECDVLQPGQKKMWDLRLEVRSG